MKARMLSFVCLALILAYIITMFRSAVSASNGQLGAAISWLSFMEILTPTLILGLTLAIHFIHKIMAT